MNVFLDIETIPSQDESVANQIAETIKPPGNIKKSESIEEWNKTEKPNAVKEAVAKTALDGTYGQIVCIGYAFGDGNAVTVSGDDEAQLLRLFFDDLQDKFQILCEARDSGGYAFLNEPITFIGHNLNDFDLRFIFHRAVINKVKPPMCFPINAKSWEESIFDTMKYWAGYKGFISLDMLCKALGLEGKGTEFTWEDVFPAYLRGDFISIGDYCKGDVNKTRDVYKRLTFQ